MSIPPRRLLPIAFLLLGGCASSWTRTELNLGLATPGAAVTDREFQQFLDEVVTPRFPDGYTVIAAEGRYRAPGAARTITEPTRILLILRPRSDETNAKVDLIRREYISRFDQKSVLRVDQPAGVGF